MLSSGTVEEAVLVRLPVHPLPRELAPDAGDGQQLLELQVHVVFLKAYL